MVLALTGDTLGTPKSLKFPTNSSSSWKRECSEAHIQFIRTPRYCIPFFFTLCSYKSDIDRTSVYITNSKCISIFFCSSTRWDTKIRLRKRKRKLSRQIETLVHACMPLHFLEQSSQKTLRQTKISIFSSSPSYSAPYHLHF